MPQGCKKTLQPEFCKGTFSFFKTAEILPSLCAKLACAAIWACALYQTPGSSRFTTMMLVEPWDEIANQFYWQTPFEKVAWIRSWQFRCVFYLFGSIQDNPHWSIASIHGITKSKKMLINDSMINQNSTHIHPPSSNMQNAATSIGGLPYQLRSRLARRSISIRAIAMHQCSGSRMGQRMCHTIASRPGFTMSGWLFHAFLLEMMILFD